MRSPWREAHEVANLDDLGIQVAAASAMDLVPLGRAVLCQDCLRISQSTGNCVGCGSSALLNVAAVLDREAAPDDGSAVRERSVRAIARDAIHDYRRRRLDNGSVIERSIGMVERAEFNAHPRPELEMVPR